MSKKNKGILKFFAGLVVGIGIGLASNSIGIGIAVGIALVEEFRYGKISELVDRLMNLLTRK